MNQLLTKSNIIKREDQNVKIGLKNLSNSVNRVNEMHISRDSFHMVSRKDYSFHSGSKESRREDYKDENSVI